MRGAWLVITIVALAGCGDRRSFDQRYNDTSSALANEAQQLDANLMAENLPSADGNGAQPAR